MKTRNAVSSLLLFLMPLLVFGQYQPSIYDIREFGAVGDGVTLNTSFIQSAIDSCAAAGGGSAADAAKREFNEYTLENLDGWWPEFYGVGTLSAHGIYARHIDGLSIDNVNIRTAGKDLRPAIVLEDVTHVDVSNTKTWGNQEAESVFRFVNVQEAYVSNCKSHGDVSSFLRIEGKDSKAIFVSDDNCYQAITQVEVSEEVPGDVMVPIR